MPGFQDGAYAPSEQVPGILSDSGSPASPDGVWKEIMPRAHVIGAAMASVICVSLVAPRLVQAAAKDYRFELAGKPQPGRSGKSVVSIRLVRIADSKPVTDAIVFEGKADMGPAGMVAMTAPVKILPAQGGVYRLEVEPGMAGAWAINLAAKVQGEAETVRGSVTAELVK